MSETASIQLHADINLLRKELQQARDEFRQFDKDIVNAASGLKKVEESAKSGGNALGGFFKQIVAGTIFANGLTGVFMKVKDTIVDFAKYSIQASSALTELNSKAKVVFENSFPQIQKQVKAISQEVGRASSSVLQFATDIGAIFNAVGVSKQDLGEMSTTIAKLAIDLASFSNTTDQAAFDALQSGLVGMVAPMRQFGVVLTEANLKEYALTKGIKDNYDSMNEAQKVILRYNFILDHTKNAQGDAARTANSFANESKRLTGEITTMAEAMGDAATPVLADSMGDLAGSLQTVRIFIGLLLTDIKSLGDVMSSVLGIGGLTNLKENIKTGTVNKISEFLGGRLGVPKQFAQIAGGFAAGKIEDQLKDPLGIQARINEAKQSEAAAAESQYKRKLQEMLDAAKAAGVGGSAAGGSKSAAKEAEKAANDAKRAEDDLLNALKEEAKGNVERLTQRKEELDLRQKLIGLTKQEQRELDTINKRTVFMKDKINEVTRAWEDQKNKLDDVNEKIADINKKIVDESRDLTKTLAKIEADAAKDKVDKAAEIIKQMNEIRAKSNTPGGLSGDESYKYGQLEDQLKGYGQSTIDQAKQVSTLSPSELIDREKNLKIEAAKAESDAKMKALMDELSAAQRSRDEIVKLEAEKKQAVINALAERTQATQNAYKLINDATKAHVDAEIAEYNRLRAAISAPAVVSSPVRRASGGAVYGPGGPTDDKIHALLSNGEFVVNAAATRRNRLLLEKINSETIPRFANGGVVTNNNQSTANLTVNAYGESANHISGSRLLWELRKRR